MTTPQQRSDAEANVLADTSDAWVRSIPWGRRAAFAVLLAAIFVVSAETTARIHDLARRGVPFLATPDLTHDLILRDSLGPRGRPNGRFERWQLNSAGFRSPESVLTPAPGCLRVMTLGSSETFGAEGESPGREYPAQLADSLAPHGCYQVMNAAIVGMSIPGMIRLWEVWASRYHPAVVVVLANPVFYLAEKPPASPQRMSGGAATGPPWAPRLLIRVRETFQYPAFIQRLRERRNMTTLTAGHPESWFFRSLPVDRLEQYRHDLDSLTTALRARGAEPVLAVYPTRFGEAPSEQDADLMAAWRQFTPRAKPEVMLAFVTSAADVVRDLGRRREVAVVDLASSVTGRREFFSDFVHYTDAGASVVAGRVAGVVRAVAVAPAGSPVSR